MDLRVGDGTVRRLGLSKGIQRAVTVYVTLGVTSAKLRVARVVRKPRIKGEK
ncbi:MAG: hypothetical protein ACUVRQ_02995 [Thermoanaerobaculaceae bacterium]